MSTMASSEQDISQTVKTSVPRASRDAQSMVVGFTRTANEKIETLVSDSPALLSQRRVLDDSLGFLLGAWYPKRVARMVPLGIERAVLTGVQTSEDYALLPNHLRELLDAEMILRTVPTPSSDFQALMYVQEGHFPAGRTGALLYREKPVIVEVGGKQFVVEIKGVGVPNGDNSISELMCRSSIFGQGHVKYGGLEVEQGRREFRNLEILRREQSSSFKGKNSPRALFLAEYDGKVRYFGDNTQQAYLLRLSPTTIRASFGGNDSFPNVRNKPTQIARDLASQLAECMNLEAMLLHTCAHSENLVLTTQGFSFTDFSDMRAFGELVDPHEVVNRVFVDFVDEIPGRTKKDIRAYSRTLCAALAIPWDDSYEHPKKLAHAVWSQWAAPRVFEQRLRGVDPSRLDMLANVALYEKTPSELEEDIIKNGITHEQLYRELAASAKLALDDLNEWIPKFAAIQGGVRACRAFYAGRDYASWPKEKLLSLARSEYDRRKRARPEKISEYREYMEKARRIQKAQGKPRALLLADRELGHEVLSALDCISEYLEKEIAMLSVVSASNAKPYLRKARHHLKRTKEFQSHRSNGYSVIDELRRNAGLYVELTTVY